MFDAFFKDAAVAGVPLLLILIGLVQFIKGFGLEGRQVRLLSAAVGLILGFGYQLSTGGPAGFSGWFEAVIFGLALGLTGSGLYDANAQSSGVRRPARAG